MAKIKKLTVKILLDIVMCLALVLLYKAKVLTLTYHEVVGIAILFVFLIHILLNRKWVVNVGKKLFSPSTPARTKFSYWMTILLVICFVAIVITGIFFSKILFKGLFGPDYEAPRIWRTLHLWFSAVSLILVGIHVGLYWDMVKGFFRKYITLPAVTTKVVCYVALAAIVVWGAISIPQTGMTNWLTGQSNRSHGGDRGAATQVEGAAEGAEAAGDGEATGERSGHGSSDASTEDASDDAATSERSGHGSGEDADDASDGDGEVSGTSERSGRGSSDADASGDESATTSERSGHGSSDASTEDPSDGAATGERSGRGSSDAADDASDGDEASATSERSGHGSNDADASGDEAAATSERSGHGSGEGDEAAQASAEGEQAASSGRSGNHGTNVTLSGTLLVISQFTCIIGLFAAITYWIDRLLKKNRRRKKAEATSESKE